MKFAECHVAMIYYDDCDYSQLLKISVGSRAGLGAGGTSRYSDTYSNVIFWFLKNVSNKTDNENGL